jgi:hypothetical protein
MDERGVVVTMENFIHADSTRAYLKELAHTDNKVNVVRPNREFANTDNQDVIRMNSDTLYSRIILDVKGGATVTTEDYEGYQSIAILDNNHSQIMALTGAGTLEVDETMLTEGQHAYIIIRTGLLRELSDEEMMEKAHEAQDNISITYNSSEAFVPSVDYDLSTIDAVKYQIFEDYAKNPRPVIKTGFGTMQERDESAARVVVAIGWGGLAGKQAVYSSFTATGEKKQLIIDKPNLNFDEKAFFSFTVYNENGWIATQKYAINSDDMEVNEDGTYTITFLASGEPVLDRDKNIVITPRGKMWTGVLRAYHPVDKDETFAWADGVTERAMTEFKK